MSDQVSDHVWSTVMSAEILASLIKGFPRTRTRTRTKQNVDPAGKKEGVPQESTTVQWPAL
jgi:hypothetical protein